MQHEITKNLPLLNSSGELTKAGYAKSPQWSYNRDRIKASRLRIKEWDYYNICNDDFSIALTISDNSYMGLDSISFIYFGACPWEVTKSEMQFFTLGKKGLPENSGKGIIHTSGKHYSIDFETKEKERILTFHMDRFKDGQPINGTINLDCPPQDSMVIATPFAEDSKAFYYNQKINCMPASGHVAIGETTYYLSSDTSCAVLDWGRGVWTYKNTWYWGSASGYVGGISFGFNIGYGFGDTSMATENMLFYDGTAHKLSHVRFNIPIKDGHDDFMSPWTFTSDDGRFEMNFVPIIDRANLTDFKILCSDQHQVFGRFSGKAVLDDGMVLEIENLTGFAEKVFNKW